jgi:kynurenine formamidase
MSSPLADTAATPSLLLDELRRARRDADAAEAEAEARILQIAVEWAHAHPVLDGAEAWQVTSTTAVPLAEVDGNALGLDVTDPDAEERAEWCGIPPLTWDSPAAFAAANRMSTAAGKALIRDALVLHHRLPRVWARVCAGQLPAWRARRIAQSVLAAPADVVAYLDGEVAPVAATIGTTALDRVLERAMLELHAEALELDHAGATDEHHVTLHDAARDGSAELHARGDWKDLHDLERAVTDVAAALAATGDAEPLDARRARALGILADPAQALALLTGTAAPPPAKQAVLYLHLTDLALLGLDTAGTVGANETTHRAVLTHHIHQWLARDDTHVVVRPVLDLADNLHTEAYAVPDRLREQTGLINPTCVFPWCTHPARRCDRDHIEPWTTDQGGGPTTTDNLAPLCRHHQRLKTHTAWAYRRLEPRVFLWTDPSGHHYLHHHGGTRVVDESGLGVTT